MIEDLISTGGSVLRAVDAVKNEGYDVLGVAAVFSYELQKAVDNFKGVRLHTLSSYPVLIEQALTSNYITEADLESLKSWRENPEEYGK